jgi:XTP/dITP diphosphohydrolase
MHTLIFATNNAHKIEEIQRVVGSKFNIQSLKDAGIAIDIPEPHDTLTENALEKANTIFQLTGKDCFSEDTGLEVAALHGAPGVKSARYAGEPPSDEANMQKLLLELSGKTDRQAQFRTVIALIIDHQVHYFEGICKGQIAHTPQGNQGFGYDPIFIPDGADRCFALMSIEEKNQYSHRRQATEKLILFLENFSQTSLT